LPVDFYRCVKGSLTLKEQYRLRVFDNTILGKIFGLKRKAGENCIIRSFINFVANMGS
jgi:hypothetical protein